MNTELMFVSNCCFVSSPRLEIEIPEDNSNITTGLHHKHYCRECDNECKPIWKRVIVNE